MDSSKLVSIWIIPSLIFSSLYLDAKGFIVDPEIYLVNDVAGTLKQFLRSLPDPLLTHHLYAAFINAARECHSLLSSLFT